MIGSGYVGTVVAACLASLGCDVVAIEADGAKCELLARADPPFHEPGLRELLAQSLGTRRLRFTTSIAEGLDASRVVFVCVGTPSGTDGRSDMTAMRARLQWRSGGTCARRTSSSPRARCRSGAGTG